MLTDPALLQKYTEDFTSDTKANAKPGPATKSYAELKGETGPLSIKASTIYQQYTCEVPVRKPTGSLIVTIVLADLVFISALWKTFNWATTYYLSKREPTAMHCEGCSGPPIQKSGKWPYQPVKQLAVDKKVDGLGGTGV